MVEAPVLVPHLLEVGGSYLDVGLDGGQGLDADADAGRDGSSCGRGHLHQPLAVLLGPGDNAVAGLGLDDGQQDRWLQVVLGSSHGDRGGQLSRARRVHGTPQFLRTFQNHSLDGCRTRCLVCGAGGHASLSLT